MKILVLLLTFVTLIYSQTKKSESKGKITYVENIVKKKDKKDSSWVKTKNGTFVKSGDKVRTYKKSRAEVDIEGLTVVRLAPKTTIDISKLYEESEDKKIKTSISVEEGEVWSNTVKVHDDMEFDVNTDVAGMAIKGTIFRVTKKDNGNTKLKVYKGAVAISNSGVAKQSNTLKMTKGRFQVGPPKKISGPRKVSIKEWTEIVKNMQEIEISKDGLMLFKKNFDFSAPDEQSEWAKWNRQRDSLLVIEKKRNER